MNEQLKQRIEKIKEHCNAISRVFVGGHADTCRALLASIKIFELLHAWAALEDIANAWDGETQRTDGGKTE